MKHLSKIFLVGCLIFGLIAHQASAQKVEKKREINKQYNNARKLEVRNKYGKLHVNTHNGSQLKVKVEIVAKASSEAKALEIFDNISIDIKEQAGLIIFETNTSRNSRSWGNKRSYEINYTVEAPKNLALDLSNKFGSTYLADHSGELKLNSSYGSLKAEKLTGNNNDIRISYGSGMISYLAAGKLSIAYSGGVSLGQGGNIDLNLRYSEMKAEQIDKIEGSAHYSEFNIDKLSKQLDLELRYMDGVNIREVAAGFQSIEIEASYSNLKLDFAQNAKYNFTADMAYSNLKMPQGTKYNKEEKSHTHTYYEGIYNNGGTAKVNIKSRYGNVTFQ